MPRAFRYMLAYERSEYKANLYRESRKMPVEMFTDGLDGYSELIAGPDVSFLTGLK